MERKLASAVVVARNVVLNPRLVLRALSAGAEVVGESIMTQLRWRRRLGFELLQMRWRYS